MRLMDFQQSIEKQALGVREVYSEYRFGVDTGRELCSLAVTSQL
jgi:hypothetical protein